MIRLHSFSESSCSLPESITKVGSPRHCSLLKELYGCLLLACTEVGIYHAVDVPVKCSLEGLREVIVCAIDVVHIVVESLDESTVYRCRRPELTLCPICVRKIEQLGEVDWTEYDGVLWISLLGQSVNLRAKLVNRLTW